METSASPTAPLPVVVGVDGSDSAANAVRWAAAEAARLGAPLRVVAAWEVPATAVWGPVTTPAADPEVFRGGAAEAAEAAAALVRAEAGEGGPAVEVELRHGPAVPELLAAAEGASCLVVGTHGRGRLARAVLGSVSAACAHHTPVPLVVVGEAGPASGGDVVVGFDGSAASRAAVQWAARHARAVGAGLRVVHVWASPLGDPAEVAIDGGVVTDPTPAVVEAVAEVLDEAGIAERPATTVQVVAGNAGRALVEAAEGAAALVVGRRGLGGFAGLLLGSVAHSCLHHASGPVVVVPPPA